ncbi:MAG TPA: ABC transporter ATP-binding protein/permease [Stellaceae bacterium]|nr:ABC transporter ATP-binding protein/permease [Stellaceae bacterium]
MKGVAALAASVEAVPGIRSLPYLRQRLGRAPAIDSSLLTSPPPAAPPASSQTEGLEPTVYRFIFKYSSKQQLILLFLTLSSFPFLYFSLELPKTIINHAIRESAQFPQTVLGFQFDRVPYLIVLCFTFLLMVLINGGFKFYINTFKGRLGERMLRRFRYQLYQRMLRFPLAHFHRTSSAQIIPMITAECEQLGGFIGDAVALPAFQGGTLLTIVFFMFMQDPVLGAAAIALYPIQGYVIPKLQRKTNLLGKQRVRTVRVVADRVQETAAGMVEIHADDMVKLQLTDFAHLLGRIYDIRFRIYQRKFFTKFLNNFINQLTPFFFYLIGGYLVIRGSLSFGALVAVLAAYKDMASPWKELLDFYQNKENTRITYDQIIEQFQSSEMLDEATLLDREEGVVFAGELVASNVSLSEDDRSRVVDAVSFTMALGEHVAVIGQGGSGKNELALLLARLVRPTSGRIAIGGRNLADLPVSVVGSRIGYAGATPYLFSGTLRENLLLSLRHRPVQAAKYDEDEARRRARQLEEARRSGNIAFDLHADWIDYEAAGVADAAGLSRRIAELLARLDFEEDVYSFGLRGRIDPAADPGLTERLIGARRELARRLEAESISHLVETYDPARYNQNASVAENLLFGTPIGPVFEFDALADNAYVQAVLDGQGLTGDLVEMGRQIAATMTEMFAGLPPGHEFFEQFSFISADDLPEFAALLDGIDSSGIAGLKRPQRQKLLSLPFKLVAARHRLDVLDEPMQQRLLEARAAFRRDLPEEAKGQIEFFDPDRYNAAASLQDNILFGRIAYGEAEAPVRVPALLAKLLEDSALRPAVVDVGLDCQVGTGGSRLSLAQRQRTAIARALLKRPDLLVLNEATGALDGPAQAKVGEGLRREMAGRGLVWVLHRASLARDFERVLVMSGGKLAEQGRFADLDSKDSLTALLIAAE